MKQGKRETLIYLPAIVADRSRPDYLATVDVDPESPTYSQASAPLCCSKKCAGAKFQNDKEHVLVSADISC